jgi:hypothetical protein
MSENQAVEVMPIEGTQQLMRRATDVAGVCKQIVLKTVLEIQGRKYVRVEGWQAIATAHGCIASSRGVEKVEGGWKAIGEIRRITDGVVLSTAEGFVGVDETKTWATRPEYACRAMAQTRAISRACRSAFAHVVVLMDAGLQTTPAEEVPDGGFVEEKAEPKAEPIVPQSPPVSSTPSDWRNFRIPFGKHKDKKLGEVADNTVGWFIDHFTVEQSFKGKDGFLHNKKPETIAKDQAFRDALDAARQDMLDRARQMKSDNDGDNVPM